MEIEEINKKAKEAFLDGVDNERDTAMLRLGYETAYKEISALPTIKGWVARNRFGSLGIFHGEQVPRKDKEDGFWYVLGEDYIDNTIFPDLRWEDEPREVEIIIKTK